MGDRCNNEKWGRRDETKCIDGIGGVSTSDVVLMNARGPARGQTTAKMQVLKAKNLSGRSLLPVIRHMEFLFGIKSLELISGMRCAYWQHGLLAVWRL